MGDLNQIADQQNITFQKTKLDDSTFDAIKETNGMITNMLLDFGQIYIRKKELNSELIRLDDNLERLDDEFKAKNMDLQDIMNSIEEKYPRHQLDFETGTITYQPGAMSRIEEQRQREQQQQQKFSVVKE